MSSDDFADEQMAAQARAAQAAEAQARRQQRHRKLRKRLAWAGGLLALVAVCLGAWYWRGLASRDHPWENSLGMKFVPVAGTAVLFGVWDVRVRDYAAYAQANRGIVESWQDPGFPQEETHPVVNVSWEEAKAFCEWLTRKERAEGRIGAGQSYRLPTDAEWSVAVGLPTERGATPRDKDRMTPDVYPWGREWPPPSGAGNYAESLKVDSYAFTSPVGSFKANQYGLYDMGGNVYQWCEDWYDTGQKFHVLRGASWSHANPDANFVLLLSSSRFPVSPRYPLNDAGFRCVLEGGSPP